MAEYGNNFSNNSGDYSFTTTGHAFSDSDYVVVSKPEFSKVSVENTSDEGNNVTTYGSNYEVTYNQTKITDSFYVAYFNFPENRNTQGSISGEFSCYVGSSKTSKYYNEPAKADDPSNGVSTDGETLYPYRHSLPFVGTTDTRGYRKSWVSITPVVKFNLLSYDNGTDGYSTVTFTQARKYARQTFLNEVDPKGLFNMTVTNHDDAKSTSPTFATISNATTYYGVNFSYAYNPYNNSAKYQYTTTLDFTYNKLPTYPKKLVFTYDEKYNKMSYDGTSLKVEAKALYNNTYSGFTTSSPTDNGFTTYKRYCDLTYNFKVFNSSKTPTNTQGTFRIWQPASQLGISYKWSIDNNPSWAHLSNTIGNVTTVTFDKQEHVKPSISGKLSLELTKYTIDNGHGVYGTITGNEWELPTNKASRSCVLRQNMTVTNCIAQNITPQDNDNQPYQTITMVQQGMYWNDPAFNMKWKVTQESKDTSTYNDNYDHGYPTITVYNNTISSTNKVTSTDNSEKTNYWQYNTFQKSVIVYMPTIPQPWVHTQNNGTAKLSYTDNFSYNSTTKGETKTVSFNPINMTYVYGYTSGVSGRSWKISNTSNDKTEEETGSVGTFDDTIITMPSIATSNYHKGYSTFYLYRTDSNWESSALSGTPNTTTYKNWVTYKYTPYQTILGNAHGTSNLHTITMSCQDNLPTIGSWTATVDTSNNKIKYTSTTKNSSDRYFPITVVGEVYQDGIVTTDTNDFKLKQYGTNISGTITIEGSGDGLTKCDSSVVYPIDGNEKTSSFSLHSREQLYLTGAGLVEARYLKFDTSGYISASGQKITAILRGEPDQESSSRKTYTYNIKVSSNIVSDYPTNAPSNGIVLSGKVTPYYAEYKYQYRIEYSDNKGTTEWLDGEINSSSDIVGIHYVDQNINSPSTDNYPSLTANTNYTIIGGFYDYKPGRYTVSGTDYRNITVRSRVVDTNDNSKIYEGKSDVWTQDKSDAEDYIRRSNYMIYPHSEYNCTVSNSFEYYGGDTEEDKVGAFTANSVSPISDPTENNGNSDDPQTYIFNLSDTRKYDKSDSDVSSTALNATTFSYYEGETISIDFGINTYSPNSIIRSVTGKKSWNFCYQYSVYTFEETYDNRNKSSVLTGYDEINGSGSITLKPYISFNGGDWALVTSTNKTTTLSTKGSYTIEIAWRTNSDDATNQLGYNKYTCNIEIKGYIYEYQISECYLKLNPSVTYTAFVTAPTSWTSYITGGKYQAQSRYRKETDTSYTDWKNCSTSYNIYCSCLNDSSLNGNKSSLSYTNIKQGSNGSDGCPLTITFVLKVWATDNPDTSKTESFSNTFMWYGKSYYNS